ncbi:hypothetical protein EMCRGX_G033404 [Ephydatia muelleri]
MWRFCGVKLPILSLSRVSTRFSVFNAPRVVHSASEKCIPRVLAVPSLGLAYHLLASQRVVANCKRAPSVPSRLLHRKFQDPKFDWSLFWKFLSPDLFLMCLAVLSAVVVAVLNFQIPLFLGQLVNVVAALEPGKQLVFYAAQLAQPGAKLLGLYCVQSLGTLFYIYLLSVVGERFALRLRTHLFRSLIEQDISFFDDHKTGELVNRLSADVQDFKSSFKEVISQGLRSFTQTVGCVGSLFFISPQMTAVVGVSLPLMIAVGSVLGHVLRRWSRDAQEQVSVATGVADEALSNIHTVRSFAMETQESKLFESELRKSCWLNEKLGVGIAVFQALSNLAINGLVLVVVSHGGILLATNQITAGDLMSFLVATQIIQRSLGNLSQIFGQTVRGMSAGARVFEYMKLHPSIPLRGGRSLSEDIQGRVEFKGVHFTYPSRPEQPILVDFNLHVPPGKVTAMCGVSGAGKSTVAALLERFYDPQVGDILIDGHPLRDLDPSWLRENVIGFIKQEPVLFGTSVMENIRYGKPTATDEEVFDAARRANAHDFICGFPDGYQTLVGERGHAVSGGQKQRIAIARALIKNPKILILDEATSALDTQSEKMVQQALDKAAQGRTVIVIAHRLSTIQGAHQIAVLHRGQLVEVGTHQELLKKNSLYAAMISRQLLTEQRN